MAKEIARNGGPASSSPDLSFSAAFPSAPLRGECAQFVSGQPAEVVIGITNTAQHPTSIFAISGYFANPKNSSKSILDVIDRGNSPKSFD
ncbi:hypothetical protein HDU84_007601 [Entophlyctis sp. JEL0112]|nr:hypothetical protein HDU84_007601 [Entophlyctis sp. JEL0112]